MSERKVLRGFIGEIPSYLRQALQKFAHDTRSDLAPVSFEIVCEVSSKEAPEERVRPHPDDDATGFSREPLWPKPMPPYDVGC